MANPINVHIDDIKYLIPGDPYLIRAGYFKEAQALPEFKNIPDNQKRRFSTTNHRWFFSHKWLKEGIPFGEDEGTIISFIELHIPDDEYIFIDWCSLSQDIIKHNNPQSIDEFNKLMAGINWVITNSHLVSFVKSSFWESAWCKFELALGLLTEHSCIHIVQSTENCGKHVNDIPFKKRTLSVQDVREFINNVHKDMGTFTCTIPNDKAVLAGKLRAFVGLYEARLKDDFALKLLVE
jgi:hypothetical protein